MHIALVLIKQFCLNRFYIDISIQLYARNRLQTQTHNVLLQDWLIIYFPTIHQVYYQKNYKLRSYNVILYVFF